MQHTGEKQISVSNCIARDIISSSARSFPSCKTVERWRKILHVGLTLRGATSSSSISIERLRKTQEGKARLERWWNSCHPPPTPSPPDPLPSPTYFLEEQFISFRPPGRSGRGKIGYHGDLCYTHPSTQCCSECAGMHHALYMYKNWRGEESTRVFMHAGPCKQTNKQKNKRERELRENGKTLFILNSSHL